MVRIYWYKDTNKQFELRAKIRSHVEALTDSFDKQERLAQARLELDSLLLEIKYFQQYCSETNFASSNVKARRHMKSKKLMQLWQECYEFSEQERVLSFWFKIKSSFVYRISNWKFYKNNLSIIITYLQNLFYQIV